MLTLINGEFGPSSALRRCHHPELGVLLVTTKFGRNGSADVVDLATAVSIARGLKAFAENEQRHRQDERGADGVKGCASPIKEAERQTPALAPRKRQSRQRRPRGSDTKPAA